MLKAAPPPSTSVCFLNFKYFNSFKWNIKPFDVSSGCCVFLKVQMEILFIIILYYFPLCRVRAIKVKFVERYKTFPMEFIYSSVIGKQILPFIAQTTPSLLTFQRRYLFFSLTQLLLSLQNVKY